MLGTQMRELAVYPQDVVPEHLSDRSLPPDEQLEEAIHENEAFASVRPDITHSRARAHLALASVHVLFTFPFPSRAQQIQHKHLARALAVAQTATPCKILCGECMGGLYISEALADVHPSGFPQASLAISPTCT